MAGRAGAGGQPVRPRRNSMNGGQYVDPLDQGRYVGNPNHANQKQLIQNNPNLLTDAMNRPQLSTPAGFAPINDAPNLGLGGRPRIQDTMMRNPDGTPFGGGGSLRKLVPNRPTLETGGMLPMPSPMPGQPDLVQPIAGAIYGGTINPETGRRFPIDTGMGYEGPIRGSGAGGIQRSQQPANINTLAAEGIKGAGIGAANAMGYTPQQVAVAGNSATVNPTNIVGSDVVNANVVGSNVNPALNAVTGSNVDPSQYNVTGSNVDASLNNVVGTDVAGTDVTAQQVGQQNASPTVMAERLRDTSLTPYMNQYEDAVVQANEADILRGANMGLDMLGAQAQRAGGFGGSRHGIAMSEMGRGAAEALARSSAGLRQAGFQNAQQMANQDIANNFQSQMANQQGGQFDVNTNMQGQLANQGANLQASQLNQQNALQAGLANQQNALQARLANQQAGMQGQLANQANALQAQGLNQQYGMQGALANQGNLLQAQGMNQQYGMQGQLANQGNALQAALANQGAGLQSGLANQQNALNSALANQNFNFQGQRANQQAGQQDISNRLQAALANQGAGLQGNQQRMGAASQLGNIANLGFNMGQTVNNNLQNQGAMQQALQQAIMDAGQNKFNQWAGHPAAGLGYLNNALTNTPNANTVTETQNKGLFDYLTLGASMMGK
jgi:hypothetical protein